MTEYRRLTLMCVLSLVATGTTFHLLYKAYVVKAKQYDSSENQEKFMRYMSKALQFLDITEQIMVIGKPFAESAKS